MDDPFTILLNQKAGTLRARVTAEDLRRMVEERGLNAEVVAPEDGDAITALLRQKVAEGARLVAVAGGDGTVARAAQKLAHSGTALGILPAGSANNFAHALGLPMEIPAALDVLKEGEVRAVSLGKVGETYFTEAAGVGLFADALALYRDTDKNLFRALYAVARVFLTYRTHRLRLVLDGRPAIEDAVMCTAANTPRLADALPIAPDADPQNEALEVVTIGNLSRWELLRYYQAVRRGAHTELAKVKTQRAREIKIEAARPLNVHADDEIVDKTPTTIVVQLGALKVLVPPMSEGTPSGVQPLI